MASDNLGPAHPCQGCIHRGPVHVATDPRTQPLRGRWCTQCMGIGRYDRVFPGDPLPKWCPGKEQRGNRE